MLEFYAVKNKRGLECLDSQSRYGRAENGPLSIGRPFRVEAVWISGT